MNYPENLAMHNKSRVQVIKRRAILAITSIQVDGETLRSASIAIFVFRDFIPDQGCSSFSGVSLKKR
ncbi:hypothetical protein [Caballeronia sp. LZ035]|uniref:hypothetical protein n=1 Tax=Caballeronia sp. LZ035 TaxID=3038568 RepID=UPI002865A95F|nr:hypothetical protein [Caballeronia sp. LZ035]MDR5762381.1 hypothetical protein [Caballeronia sp. LZ035]